MLRQFYFLAIFLVVGCGKDEFPKYNVLDRLRVITLVADTPEISLSSASSTAVQIRPYISDVGGPGGLSYVAQGCWNFEMENGGEPTCVGNSTRQDIASGNLTQPTAADAYTGAADAFTVTIPAANALMLARSTAAKYNGIPYLLTYELTNSSGQKVKSFKRILVSTKPTKNSNPQVVDILKSSSKSSLSAFSLGQKEDLSFSIGANSSDGAESYLWQSDQGEIKSYAEELTATWFVTDGSMKYYRTTGSSGSNSYQNPDSAPAANRKAFVILVLRDDRGGVGIKLNSLN